MQVQSVEQVEVVRGPFSSLYGANAFAGAINAITRPGVGAPTADFFASGGNAGYHQYGASARGETGPVGYSFTADRRRIDNVYNRETRISGSRTLPLRNVGYEDVRMSGRLDFAPADAWRVSLLPRISRYTTGLDVTGRLPSAVDENRTATSVNLGGTIRHQGAGPVSTQIKVSQRVSRQRIFQENYTRTRRSRRPSSGFPARVSAKRWSGACTPSPPSRSGIRQSRACWSSRSSPGRRASVTPSYSGPPTSATVGPSATASSSTARTCSGRTRTSPRKPRGCRPTCSPAVPSIRPSASSATRPSGTCSRCRTDPGNDSTSRRPTCRTNGM